MVGQSAAIHGPIVAGHLGVGDHGIAFRPDAGSSGTRSIVVDGASLQEQ